MIKEWNEESVKTFMNEWLQATLVVATKDDVMIADPSIKFDSNKLSIALDVTNFNGANPYGPTEGERTYHTAADGHICEIIPFPVAK